jgi:dTDP-4-amino-4,6-dideoxygalactose transaminase
MFRIWLYLDFLNFLQSLFIRKNDKFLNFIQQKISKQSDKKYVLLASQCRVGFLFVLKYLKLKSKKKEIIFCAYNLPEMVNVAVKLNYKIRFCDLNYKTGSMNVKEIEKKISKNTAAIVLTNMFNDFKNSREIKNLARKYQISLIEDNAIYFDNHIKKNNKIYYSGSFGNFSIYSFNIMKNISAFYGGAISTNDKEFKDYYEKEYNNLNNFPKILFIKQVLIFLILKIMSVNIFFKLFFLHIIKFAHNYNFSVILRLIYPSLKLLKKSLPNYYFSMISQLSIFSIYVQLKNEKKRKRIFVSRKSKHAYYLKKIKIIKNNLSIINTKDKNFQNFLDFPLLVKNKKSLNKFLLNNGIEVRYKHYYNCEKLFRKNKSCINAERYENELICLPLHPKIDYDYIDFIANKIRQFYLKKN